MAIESGFYTGQPITAELLNTAFAGVVSNGVRLAYTADELQVVKNANMLINIKQGYAVIEGSILHNTDNYTLTVETADGVLDRIDRVVARQDKSTSPVTNKILIIKGALSDTPTAPDLVRDGTYYDLSLATISVPAGTTEITDDLITDTRFNTNVCGEMHALVQGVDLGGYLENIYAQLETLKGQLSEGDIATSLQCQINSINDETIGGDNLVPDPLFENGLDNWNSNDISKWDVIEQLSFNQNKIIRLNWTNSEDIYIYKDILVPNRKNKQYVVTLWIYVNGASQGQNTLGVHVIGVDNATIKETYVFDMSTIIGYGWVKRAMSFTVLTDEDAWSHIRLFYDATEVSFVMIAKPMLQEGTIATAFKLPAGTGLTEKDVFAYCADGVTEIPDQTSTVNWYMPKVCVPDSVITVGNNFMLNAPIQEFFGGENIESFGTYALAGTSSKLTSIYLPSARVFGDYAFANVSTLSEVNLPNAEVFGNWVFKQLNIETLSLPKATSIDSYFVYMCANLKTVNLPSITSLGDNAFSSCDVLTNISFGSRNNVLTIISRMQLRSTLLTDASFLEVANALVTNNTGSAITIYVKSTRWATVPQSTKDIFTTKNYTITEL